MINILNLRDEYCNSISNDTAAISYEAINYISKYVCEHKKVCDLGSGFSSFVLRNFSHDITSVDDNEFWLEQTKQYCKKYDLDKIGQFLMYDTWQSIDQKYDLILYDFSNRYIRAQEFDNVIKKLSSTGLMFIDDMHKLDMAKIILEKSQRYNMTIISLRQETLDSYGRFSCLLKF